MEYEFDRFQWTYLSEFSSKSKIIIVFDNGEPVCVRGLWKTNWQEHYQLIDTSVRQKSQGKGIFGITNKFILDNELKVFNLPNSQSRPGYLKSGWIKLENIGISIFESINILSLESDELYWRFSNNPIRNYYCQYSKTRNTYKIITIRRGLGIYLGETSFKLNLPKWKYPVLLQYSKGEKRFLKKTGVILYNPNNIKPNFNVIDFDMI